MAKSIAETEQEILGEFELFDDWMDKYQYLIDMGQELDAMPAEYKVEENLVRGCQSQVWLKAVEYDGILTFYADSDAIITKGIIALLIRVLSEQSPLEIVHAELGFLDEIGLRQHLSLTRANGLNSMIKQMKYYALAYQRQN